MGQANIFTVDKDLYKRNIEICKHANSKFVNSRQSLVQKLNIIYLYKPNVNKYLILYMWLYT